MKPKIDILQIATLVLLFFLLWQWNKNNKATGVPIIINNTLKDSTAARPPEEVRVIPGQVPVSVPVYITIPAQGGKAGRVDTVWKPLDSLEVVKAYFSRHYWTDTLHTKWGDIVVNNQTFRNLIDSQKIIANLNFNDTVNVKGRGQVFLGVEGVGYNQAIINGIGANLAYKTPGNKIYEVGVLKINGLPLQYKAGIKMLLSLKKR